MDAASLACAGLNFNPRPPRGERLAAFFDSSTSLLFQSTSPARGATCCIFRFVYVAFISIHVPREGSDFLLFLRPCPRSSISIHAPREGSDGAYSGHEPSGCYISIHAPREGSDVTISQVPNGGTISIHAPREGSDYLASPYCTVYKHFNPRPPRGERLYVKINVIRGCIFQSTPPARGATRFMALPSSSSWHFNPRPPRGERPRGIV